jgi:hypothetical protein
MVRKLFRSDELEHHAAHIDATIDRLEEEDRDLDRRLSLLAQQADVVQRSMQSDSDFR